MFKFALIELLRRKRRTIATISGYIVAVVIFSIILNILFLSQDVSSSILKGTGTHFIAYLPLCADEVCENNVIDSKNEGFFADTIKTQIFSGSIIDNMKQFKTVRDTSPFILFKIKSYNNDLRDSFMLGGIPLNNSISVVNNSCSESNIIDGQFLNSNDNSSILLEEGFAKRYFLDVGSNININNKKYVIKGIVNSGIKPVKADIYMPINLAREVINSRLREPLKDEFNIILVESLNAKVHQDTMIHIKSILGSTGIISSYGCYKPASTVLEINSEGFWLISIIVFIGILGFSLRSQYSSILEKLYQIGILRVIGWTKNDILMEFLSESIIQSISGWIIGSLFAFSINIYISLVCYNNIKILYYLFILLYSLIFAFFGGIIAGVISGFSASKLKISYCLRKL